MHRVQTFGSSHNRGNVPVDTTCCDLVSSPRITTSSSSIGSSIRLNSISASKSKSRSSKPVSSISMVTHSKNQMGFPFSALETLLWRSYIYMDIYRDIYRGERLIEYYYDYSNYTTIHPAKYSKCRCRSFMIYVIKDTILRSHFLIVVVVVAWFFDITGIIRSMIYISKALIECNDCIIL